MQDDESDSKGGASYDRLALTDAVDWVDEPSEEEVPADEEEVLPPDDSVEDIADGLLRDSPSIHSQAARASFWNRCLLSDNRFTVCGVDLVDGPPVVKLIKFVGMTLVGICLMYKFVRAVNWEHKESFTLERFWTYESTQVVSDAVVFFTVARLWKQRGVDHLAWLLCLTASNIFMSYLPNFQFLQASFTLYDMHCKWSWKLWIFVATLIPLVLGVVFLHVRHAVQHKIFVQKILELVLAVMFWFLPYASSPYFHLHHWFAGWWVGMHANFDTWWSRATLAWCWGLYINGIAAYGRDPVLTCGYALFVAEQNRCPFLDCYLDGINTPAPVANHTNHTVVQPMVKPDWRNCSADAYHP